MENIIKYYPEPVEHLPLIGAYLAHDIRYQTRSLNRPYVYANFVTSIDGRIAVPRVNSKSLTVPKNITNERDWRLFQELAAQADLIISSGRYLREWAAGHAQEILQVDDPRFIDLRKWREAQGLSPQPDIAIVSRSLKFPIPDVLTAGGRKVIVFTVTNPDPLRTKDIETHAGQVFIAGDKKVEGDKLVEYLNQLGYKFVYSAAGPKILHLLLADRVLNRLYLTYANRILGGENFSTIVDGNYFDYPINFNLSSLYYDPEGLDGLGQIFAAYDCV